MKALVKKKPEPGIWMEDVAEPKVGENDVLIKIKKTAICGTDVHIFKWDEWAQRTIPVPMHVGHEFVGEVAGIGKSVVGIQLGQRVSGEGHIVCGHCRNCRAGARHLCIKTSGVGVNRPGAFAQLLSIPASNVFPIPDGITDDEAAVMDPLGNAVHTTLSFDLIGEDVLITGAGPIGIMASKVAHFVGARNVVITDMNPFRLELAKKMEKTSHVIDIRQKKLSDVMNDLGMTEGFDVGLEMSGNPTAFGDMVTSMRAGGKIAMLGILPDNTQISWEKVIFKGLFLKGIYGREMYETWYKMCALIQSGLDIKPIFTHHFPVQDFQKGFEIMTSGNSGKVILDWSTL